MLEVDLLQKFLVALLLGALVGLEREYTSHKKRTQEYAGIRTFPLISLFGALSAYLADVFTVYIIIAAVLILGGLIVVSYTLMNRRRKYIGATSQVAGFLVFFIGVISFQGHFRLATILAIVMTIILYARSFLHHLAERIKPKELADTLKFAVIAFVILPFLPNKTYWLFNPFIIWLMVVFITGISFVGYILMKWFGNKGLVMTAILGGIASSTATTTSFAERSRNVKFFRTLAAGVILANAVTFIVTLVEVFVLNRELFLALLLPLLVLAALGVLGSYLLWRNPHEINSSLELTSPFTLAPALKFGVFFAVILALVSIGNTYFSTEGVYLVSFLSGFATVDAVALSLAQLAGEGLALTTARNGILLALLTNMTVKGGLAWWFGSRKFSAVVLWVFALLSVFMALILVFF